MPIAIDKTLNLVIEFKEDDGRPAYVHCTPISYASFKRHWRVLTQMWSELYKSGMGPFAGPRVAGLMLAEVAEAIGYPPDGPQSIDQTLMAEIRRMTTYVQADGMLLPWDAAIASGTVDDRNQREVENALVFFTANSHLQLGAELELNQRVFAEMFNARISFSKASELLSSLKTSTKDDNTGVKDEPKPVSSPSLGPH